MEKHFLDRQTRDGAQLTIEQIAAICPSAVTEVQDENTGEIVRKVNFTTLRQLLGDLSVETPHEAYDFTWVGKTAARREAAMPISQTLRPCPEESVDWDNTKNLYIEGDNLQVLKLLQNYYAGQIKMIYIDPPYNTGHDFVYHDDFHQTIDEYEEAAGVRDELGNRFYVNNDSNGRFHSDWCSMIYPRLVIAQTLLTDDGVIFISIDDNEVENLRKICDEVFGEGNFVANLVWQKKFARSNDATYFSTMHDHILCYCKNNVLINPQGWKIGLLPRGEELPSGYGNPDNDPRGPWASVSLSAKSGSQSLAYEIVTPSGRRVLPPNGRYWCCSKETYLTWLSENRIWFGSDGDGVPRKKTFLSDVQQGLRPNTLILHTEGGHNQEGKQELKDLFDGGGYFDGPKPVRLLHLLGQIANLKKDSVVLDFFSGSATTAHAVMQLNAEDGGHRKFIMVQLPEKTTGDSDAYKAGYKNICEIGKERICRAGKKIKTDNPLTTQDLDTGFRVLKLDETNFKQVSFAAKDYSQDIMTGLIDNIKDDRSDLDLLFDCMLRWGVELSLPIVRSEADHCQILNVNEGDLVACLAHNETITETVIDAIAAMHPLRIVLRDTAFEEASQKMNIYELFKQRLGWSDDQASKQIRVI